MKAIGRVNPELLARVLMERQRVLYGELEKRSSPRPSARMKFKSR
jgi:hypothetical protein